MDIHGSDASAYSVQMSSIRPELLGTRSLMSRRAIALSSVLAVLALGAAFALVTVLPGKGQPSADNVPAARAAEVEIQVAPVPASELDQAPIAPPPARARAAEPVEARNPPPRLEPPAARRESVRLATPDPPSQRRARDYRASDDRPLRNPPASRRGPRHLDKDDPWAE
jgi:hypothetical protein